MKQVNVKNQTDNMASASGLIVSQTDAFGSVGSWESKSGFTLIGIGILELCEWSDSVADRRFRHGSVLGVEIWVYPYWHRYSGSLLVV